MSLWPKILRYENLGDRPDMIPARRRGEGRNQLVYLIVFSFS